MNRICGSEMHTIQTPTITNKLIAADPTIVAGPSSSATYLDRWGVGFGGGGEECLVMFNMN